MEVNSEEEMISKQVEKLGIVSLSPKMEKLQTDYKADLGQIFRAGYGIDYDILLKQDFGQPAPLSAEAQAQIHINKKDKKREARKPISVINNVPYTNKYVTIVTGTVTPPHPIYKNVKYRAFLKETTPLVRRFASAKKIRQIAENITAFVQKNTDNVEMKKVLFS